VSNILEGFKGQINTIGLKPFVNPVFQRGKL
jgi:hypothetical protein